MTYQNLILKACKEYSYLNKKNTAFNFSCEGKRTLNLLAKTHSTENFAIKNFALHSFLLDLGIKKTMQFGKRRIIEEISKFRVDKSNNDFKEYSFKLPTEVFQRLKNFQVDKKIPLQNEAHYIAFFVGLEEFNKIKS
tara:strand:+ start:19 stop:429 length:411 start_codon:yes stop_codon:yes gene_type:complete